MSPRTNSRLLARPLAMVLAMLAAVLVSGVAAADMLVPAGSVWKYLDDGSNQETSWRAPGFADDLWFEGPAQLGYGDGDEATPTDPGTDPSNKPITTYFRHEFSVPDASIYASLKLEVLRDDGAVVYLNGVEVFRTNMNPGPVAFDTPSTTFVSGADEDRFFPAYLTSALLVTGMNVLAVEIHQSSGTSSDISFDLSLEADIVATPVAFAWAGAVTPISARVKAGLKLDSAAVRLHVSEQSDLSDARVSAVQAADELVNQRIVDFDVRGLSPGTEYHYALAVDGALDLARQGRFTTSVASPSSFTFAFASCASTGSSHPVFDTIRAYDPLFFFHTGDFHYQNIAVNDPAVFREAYDTVLASPAQEMLYRSVPIAYVWDDHDYGPNNSDSTSPSREASRLTYQQYVPHYPLVAGSGDVPIYQAFSVGRVRFLVTDMRSERSPFVDPDMPGKTMFGAAQKAWFQQQLLDANGVYPVIVWVQSMPWIGVTGDDGWYAYTFERQEIANFIRDNAIEGLFMISGDAHMLAIDDGTNSDYATGGGAGFPVMHAAALDRGGSLKGGPYSEGAFPGSGQFGLMTITDDGVSPICIDWSGRNATDVEIVGWSTCLPAAPPADTDGDGTDDVADCAFADPETWGAPATVDTLRVERTNLTDVTLRWASQSLIVGPSATHDIVHGTLSDVRNDDGFANASCLVAAHPMPPYVETGGPPPTGEVEYFLVRTANPCGNSGFGASDASDPRYPLEGEGPCPQ